MIYMIYVWYISYLYEYIYIYTYIYIYDIYDMYLTLYNRALENYVDSKISLNKKCVFNIFTFIIHIRIIQSVLK